MSVSAVEVHLQAGDTLIFADTICHGSAQRKKRPANAASPCSAMARAGASSATATANRELLDRLTPARKQIVWPHEPFERTPNLKPDLKRPTRRNCSRSRRMVAEVRRIWDLGFKSYQVLGVDGRI